SEAMWLTTSPFVAWRSREFVVRDSDQRVHMLGQFSGIRLEAGQVFSVRTRCFLSNKLCFISKALLHVAKVISQ
ncbi:hypothetical protein O5343_26485, partial [Escherichia coli]|nr:hypothetical protein [Escherichia coli]